MSTTLLLDASGGLFIPPDVIECANWAKERSVEVEVMAEGLLVRPRTVEAALVQNDQGDWVIRNTPSITSEEVIRAIAADRR